MMTSKPMVTEDALSIDKKAWFLCKFLCKSLNEENFEKVRVHVSNCKGVKTRVKLSPKGWAVGYKPSHVRHLNQKLPYETFPLEFIEDVFQDSMFINVLLCVFRLQNIPGLEFEIVAYKFADPATAKRIEDIFQVLAGNTTVERLRAPVRQLTLIPGKAYPMGTLAPDRWGSRDRSGAGSSVEVSEVAYGRSGYTSALPYGTIIPGDVVRRRAMAGSSDRHTVASQSTDDPNEVNSYASSDVIAYREVAVMVQLDKSAALPESKGVMIFQRYRSFLYDDIPMADVACQVMATEESRGKSSNGENWIQFNGNNFSSTGFRSNGSTASGPSSEDLDEGAYLVSNGVSLSYSNVRAPRQKNIAITSMDVVDGHSRAASSYDDDDDMTSTVRRIYHRGPQDRGRRTPISELGHARTRRHLEPSENRIRSRSVEPLNEDFRYLTVSRPEDFGSRQLDVVSTRSQSSYYLDPHFTKVYAPRRNQHVKYSVYAPSSVYQDSASHVYSERDLRRTGRKY